MGVSLSFICRNVARSRSHFLHGEKYLINIVFLIFESQAHAHKTIIKHYNPGDRQCFLKLMRMDFIFIFLRYFCRKNLTIISSYTTIDLKSNYFFYFLLFKTKNV